MVSLNQTNHKRLKEHMFKIIKKKNKQTERKYSSRDQRILTKSFLFFSADQIVFCIHFTHHVLRLFEWAIFS